jgi:hypothetical protein
MLLKYSEIDTVVLISLKSSDLNIFLTHPNISYPCACQVEDSTFESSTPSCLVIRTIG